MVKNSKRGKTGRVSGTPAALQLTLGFKTEREIENALRSRAFPLRIHCQRFKITDKYKDESKGAFKNKLLANNGTRAVGWGPQQPEACTLSLGWDSDGAWWAERGNNWSGG